mmetsp:Transcript_143400/g.357281  ORF Transcript_143400/g.357281 Transcript_143400/m.357281 type:complete len:115 (+) Transcript_143400:221-565(+)
MWKGDCAVEAVVGGARSAISSVEGLATSVEVPSGEGLGQPARTPVAPEGVADWLEFKGNWRARSPRENGTHTVRMSPLGDAHGSSITGPVKVPGEDEVGGPPSAGGEASDEATG